MKKNFIYLFALCFLFVSCTGLITDGTAGGRIKIALPEIKSGGTARLADGDMNFTYTLALVSETGEKIEKSGGNGETVVFEAINPGLYTISCGALIGENEYFGSKENVEVVSGITTTVVLEIKKVAKEPESEPEESAPEEPYVPGGFFFDEFTGEYKFYFRAEDVPALKKGDIIKFTFGGVPDKNISGGLNYNYYGWNEETKQYQEASRFVNIPKTEFTAGKQMQETVYFVVTYDMPEGFHNSFDMYYHPEQLKEDFKLENFTCSFETVNMTPSKRAKISSSDKGLRFDIAKLPDDVFWRDIRIKDQISNCYVTAVDYSSDMVTLYWPFSSESSSYLFSLEGAFGPTDEYYYEEFACASTLYTKDTGSKLDPTLLKKYLDSKAELTDKSDSKIFKIQTELKAAELSKIWNFATDCYLNNTFWANEWDWCGYLELKDPELINTYFTTGIDYLATDLHYMSSYIDEVLERLSKYGNYRLESSLEFISDEYKDQHLILSSIESKNVKFNVPTVKILLRDENNCSVTWIPVKHKLNTGDYIMISLSGRLDYQLEDKSNLKPTEISFGLQDMKYDDFWMYPTAPWRFAAHNIPDSKDFAIQYGILVTDPTDEGSIQVNFSNDTEADNLLLKLWDYNYNIDYYPAKTNADGETVSTIKLIDYSKVSEDYQMPLSVALAVDSENTVYGSDNGEYKVQLTGSPNVTSYLGFITPFIREDYLNINIENYVVGYFANDDFIEDSTVQFTTTEKNVNGNLVQVPALNTPLYDVTISRALKKNEKLFIEYTLLCLPEYGLDYLDSGAKIENFVYRVHRK